MILIRSVAVIFFTVIVFISNAQQNHFVYLQTENGQSFYVKFDNKISSSSPLGYLILPKLSDGNYKLTIGFPKKEFPEENFEVSIDKNSEGYLLKNFGEKGWGLFNLQSFSVLMGGNTNQEVSSSKNLQDDLFSKMLANVVNDSSILQKNESIKKITLDSEKSDSFIARGETNTKTNLTILKLDSSEKIDTSAAVFDYDIMKDTAVALNSTPDEKTKPVPFIPATKLLKSLGKDGLEMIYVDHDENFNDTVRIFIPLEKLIPEKKDTDYSSIQKEKPINSTVSDSAANSVGQQIIQQKPDTVSMLPANDALSESKDSATKENEKQTKLDLKDSIIKPEEVKEINRKDEIIVLPQVVQSSSINSDCKAYANDEDFLKLRKKMAGETSVDNMIKIAKKLFHSKCFSTEQIKNLSFLFLKDGGKYQFFDAAYPFTSDSNQYYTLQSQLTDSYYISRFRAMIHK